MQTISVKTHQRAEFVEITDRVQKYVEESGLSRGAVIVFVPHTTAACTINENADPDVVRDMLKETSKIVPFESDYRHAEGNSDSHIKASFFGASQLILIEKGKLVLGTWQGIYFCEFDGPRDRKVHLSLMQAAP
jgi:secondary thiamine-phosphate synthase enzyme